MYINTWTSLKSSLDNGKKSGGKESYQKFKISCINEHQQKFYQTVRKCPEQIIR